jgi:tetratricopeptide (TPR) repeat protein
MTYKSMVRSACVFVLLALPQAAAAQEPKPELVTPLGKSVYARPDTANVVPKADSALAADPMNVDRILEAGHARASLWRYNDAIALYTRAIEQAPQDWRGYRFRGHRYISTRRFDLAVKDLQKAAALDSLSYDVAYHLGLAYFLSGEFDRAVDVYADCGAREDNPDLMEMEKFANYPEGYKSCMRIATNDDDRVALIEWNYRALLRAGQDEAAQHLLTYVQPGMKVVENEAYYRTLLMYKRLKTVSEVTDRASLKGNQLPTVLYGVANWYLVAGDVAKARQLFREIVDDANWNAFGYIAAERELVRMGVKKL